MNRQKSLGKQTALSPSGHGMLGMLAATVRIGAVFGLALGLVGLLMVALADGRNLVQASAPTASSAVSSAANSTANVELAERAVEAASATLAAQAAASADVTAPQVTPWTPPASAYRISVKDDGLYGLSYDYLLAAGLPVTTLNPATLRLYFMGQQIPIYVTGESDGQFNQGDQVIFYGRNVDTLFYDGKIASRNYVNELVYFLAYGGPTSNLRMATMDGTPSGATAQTFSMEHVLDEWNYWYFSEYPKLPISGGDHFFGQWIYATRDTTSSRNINFLASNVDSSSPGHVEMTLQGYAPGPHSLRLYVNNTQVYSGGNGWSDFESFAVSVPITPGLIVDGRNAIKVELYTAPFTLTNGNLRSYDKIYINVTQVDYPRQLVANLDTLNMRGVTTGTWTFSPSGFSSSDVGIYDVTDPFNVRRIVNASGTSAPVSSDQGPNGPQQTAAGVTFQAATNAGTRFFLATPSGQKTPTKIERVVPKTSVYTPAEMLDPANRYDYIIVTHGDFWDQMLPLAQFRNYFYDVAQIDVQDIYDRFNGGMMSAEAIRDFLLYAYTNWSGDKPQLVLLVGDGSVDMRNFTLRAPPTFIPPFLVSVDPYLGETAADNRFVLLEGNDLLPDMAIGRFPAGSVADVTAMVQKTLDYETNPPVGEWNQNVLFISDDLEFGGGDFYGYSDVLVSGFVDPPTNTIPYLPAPYSATRAYLGVTCDLTNASPATECQQMISETLNITGALLISYVGHASRTAWAVEDLMDGELVSGLDMTGKHPIILAMTCMEGSFHDSSVLSLAESYMRSSGGAVASWSPTGLGVATGHDVLEQSFFKNLFQNEITELGKLTVLAKQDLDHHQTDGRFDDLLDTYVLFGDPALRIQAYFGPTGVEVAEMDAVTVADAAFLSWKTASEAEIAGFNMLRAAVDASTGQILGDFQTVNSLPILAKAGGGASGADYALADQGLTPGVTYRYSLEIIKTDGTVERYGVVDVSVNDSKLEQIYLPTVVR